MEPKIIISGILVLVALAGIWGGVKNRITTGKGIGWQFIRYCTMITALPLAGILALNGVLTDGAVAIISGALGYAFGKSEE